MNNHRQLNPEQNTYADEGFRDLLHEIKHFFDIRINTGNNEMIIGGYIEKYEAFRFSEYDNADVRLDKVMQDTFGADWKIQGERWIQMKNNKLM
jgi:hypothetical protein